MFKNKIILLFLGFVFLSCFFGYFFVYQKKFVNRPIRSDAEGYYAYLPAFFIYKDFSMKKADFYQPDAKSFTYPAIYFNSTSGRYIDKYPLGVALLILPFFVLAHLVSVIDRLPLTGYTLAYQHFIGVSGIFYLTFALYFLRQLYKKYFSQKAVFLTLISLVFATNLFHYATFDSLMSHVFSFFLVSLFLYLISLWSEKPNKYRSLIIGALIGLIFLVKNINIVFVIVLLPFLKKWRKFLFLIVFSALVISFPQFLYWKYAAGKWLFFSYQGEKFNFFDPKIYQVLFSPRIGLFFWTPIFILGIFGTKLLKQRISGLFFGFLSLFLIYLFLSSSWHDWGYGASFGNRAFIEIYPILGFFLASFYEKTIKKTGLKKTVLLLIFFIVLNLTNMFKYWQRILPYDQVSLEIYLKNLFVLTK